MTKSLLAKNVISPREASQLFSISEGTLANLRCLKRGPRYYRVGRKVLYSIADFEAWLFQNPVLTTDSLAK